MSFQSGNLKKEIKKKFKRIYLNGFFRAYKSIQFTIDLDEHKALLVTYFLFSSGLIKCHRKSCDCPKVTDQVT